MCDDDIHPGLVHDPRLSRRAFGLLTVAATGVATVAQADDTVEEKDVEVKTPDGVADAALFYPKAKGKWPAVLLWPDVMSLRPVFRDMGRRLAAAGYVVLVPNLYYRVKKAPVVEGTFNFANPDDRAKLTPMRASVTPEGTFKDAAAYVAFLDAQAADQQGQEGRRAGLLHGRSAVVPHGRRRAGPDRRGGHLPRRRPGHRQGRQPAPADPQDPCRLPDRGRRQRRQAGPDREGQAEGRLRRRQASGQVEVFAGAAHGWTVKGSQVYNEAAAETAWANLLALYKKALV
jgi:carboxymethylenebutenolidase